VTMTLSLARALGPVKVNAVCPGFIQEEWLQEGIGMETYTNMKTKIEQFNPLKRTATAEDVAQAIYFLAVGQQIITR
jgi:3-oxoacyl-[acyl-carrier protein] reductase